LITLVIFWCQREKYKSPSKPIIKGGSRRTNKCHSPQQPIFVIRIVDLGDDVEDTIVVDCIVRSFVHHNQ